MRGTKSLLAHLDRIRDAVTVDVPNKVDEVVQNRTQGAQAEYQIADNPNGSLDNDITVTSEHEGSEWRIVASGSDLLFIEFGTGIIYPHTNPIDHPYNFPGSWSVDHEQYLTDSDKLAKYKGQWPYNGEWVDGNPSANVMYQTGKTIKSGLPRDLKMILDKAVKS